MKEFSLLLLIYTTTLIPCVPGFLEHVAPPPWLFTTTMQRLQPKHFANFPRSLQRQNIPKFIYWKHLLELECIKEICSYVNHKGRLNHQSPHESIKHKQMPPFGNAGVGHRNEGHDVYRTTDNQLKEEQQATRKHAGSERIILWAPDTRFPERQPNVPRVRPEFGPSRMPLLDPEMMTPRKKFHGKTEGSALVKDYVDQNNSVFPSILKSQPREKEEDKLPKAGPVDDPLPQLFLDSGPMRPSTPRHSQKAPQDYGHQPHRIQPYEVEEIIEEQFEVDLNDDREDGGMDGFGEKRLSEEKPTEKSPEVNVKINEFGSVIDDSVNTILKGLVGPVEMRLNEKVISEDVLPLEKLEDPPFWSETNSSTKSFLSGTFTTRPVTEKTKETSFDAPKSSDRIPSNLKIIYPTFSPSEHKIWRQKTAEATQKFERKPLKTEHSRLDGSRGFEFTPSSKKDASNSDLSTHSPNRLPQTEAPPPPSSHVFDTQDSPRPPDPHQDPPDHSTPPFPKTPSTPSAPSQADTLDNLDNLHSFKNLFPGHQLQSDATEKTNRLTETTQNPFVSVPATPSDDPTEASTSFEHPQTSQTTEILLKYLRTDPTGGQLTESNSVQSTDQPVSFDLLDATPKPDSRKDEEALWKNGRKMHFANEVGITNASNAVSPPDGPEQRRSDILITDDLADYADNDNNLSTLTYLEKLKQNHSLLSPDPLNLTADALIPLLPVIINDLREGKIPLQDYSILSQALDKYWSPILALSNLTNLDMLPLLKMKDKTDLENVLQYFLPEATPTTGTGATENDFGEDDYSQSYDYMDEYKELYKDILGQEFGDKKRRFRPRRDAEDALRALEATREYFESLEEERNEDGSDYFLEDIIYDEVSDSEDSSVFELMEVSDVVVGEET